MTHLCFLEEQLKNNTNDSYRLVGDKANGYIELAYHFLILNNNINKCIFDTRDKKFYKWINDKLSNNRGDSFVINLLRKYINQDDLHDFLFKPLDDNGEDIFLNIIDSVELDRNNYKEKLVKIFQENKIKISQKWHLCISWYAYKESKLMDKNYDFNKEVTKKFRCSELNDWINWENVS